MALVSKTFSQIITFTRASTATFFNSAGTLTSAAVDAPRRDYNPSTLAAQGLLIEESRTNSIRNNTMVGAVAGTPGTNPTNWANSTAGLTKTIVGIGTANGINYIDVRFNGTTSSTSLAITTDATNIIAASNGQAWTSSAWLSVVGGSTVNLNEVLLQLGQYTSAVAFLSNLNGANIVSSLTSTLTRFASTLTTNDASVAFIQPVIVLRFASGVAIDITLRIGLPQLELGAFATSVIPTTTTALTRAADVASVNTLSPWYNATEGTLFVETSRGYTGNFVNFPHTAGISDGTSNNVIWAGFGANGSQFIAPEIVTSGVDQFNFVSGSYSMATAKNAIAYKTNDSQWFFNGTAFATDTTCTMPSGLNKLSIGSDAVGSQPWNGWIRRVTYYPRRLSQAEGIAITA